MSIHILKISAGDVFQWRVLNTMPTALPHFSLTMPMALPHFSSHADGVTPFASDFIPRRKLLYPISNSGKHFGLHCFARPMRCLPVHFALPHVSVKRLQTVDGVKQMG